MAETIAPPPPAPPPPKLPAHTRPDRDSFGGLYAVNDEGHVVKRIVACEMRGCGRTYEQRLLSRRFAEMIARAGAGASQATREQIPDGYVPVFCPRCESRELGSLARELRLIR